MAVRLQATDNVETQAGCWLLLQDEVSTGCKGVAAVEEQPAPSGGWAFYFAHEQEMLRREDERRERLVKSEKSRNIPDQIEREIALEFRALEAEEARWLELERLRRLVEKYRSEVRHQSSEKVNKAADRAILQGNFSAMEALERELRKERETQRAFLEAATLLLVHQNGQVLTDEQKRFLLESTVIIGNA